MCTYYIHVQGSELNFMDFNKFAVFAITHNDMYRCMIVYHAEA